MQRNRLTTGTIELLLLAGLLGAFAPRAAGVVATGGTVTNYTDANGKIWTAHIFTTNNVATGDTNLVVTFGGTVDYLVIGGGGGGGATDNSVYAGAGGGAGQVKEGSIAVSAPGACPITVGAGGAGAPAVNTPGLNGNSSTFVVGGTTITAFGGGGGAGVNTAPAEGTVASTGGGGSNAGNPRTPGIGCFAGGSGGGSPQAGGGGGGSTGVGGNASPSSGGTGGPGYTPTKKFSAAPVIYAAGGGGGLRGGYPTAPGAGGSSGAGGGGGGGPAGVKAQNGNTYGSGGGGTAATGANGGGGNGASGIVIVRYEADTPNIANQPVTALTTTSATFNGLLASTGTSVAAVYVLWGEENGAATGRWTHNNKWKAGAWGSSTRPATNISLTPDRIYYYTFGAANATTNAVASPPVSFLAGAVGVKTSRRESSEDQPASFVIYRPATATNGALAVNYTLGGTGRNGRDYDWLDSPAIIPAGASEVRLPVFPSFIFGDQRPKMVTLTIAPGAYVIGTQSNATILTRAGAQQ